MERLKLLKNKAKIKRYKPIVKIRFYSLDFYLWSKMPKILAIFKFVIKNALILTTGVL